MGNPFFSPGTHNHVSLIQKTEGLTILSLWSHVLSANEELLIKFSLKFHDVQNKMYDFQSLPIMWCCTWNKSIYMHACTVAFWLHIILLYVWIYSFLNFSEGLRQVSQWNLHETYNTAIMVFNYSVFQVREWTKAGLHQPNRLNISIINFGKLSKWHIHWLL